MIIDEPEFNTVVLNHRVRPVAGKLAAEFVRVEARIKTVGTEEGVFLNRFLLDMTRQPFEIFFKVGGEVNRRDGMRGHI